MHLDKKDRHDIARGVAEVPPDEMYARIISIISKTPFFRIADASESLRILRIYSDRQHDPRGIIEIYIDSIPFAENNCAYSIRVTDEHFLSELRSGRLVITPMAGTGFAEILLSSVKNTTDPPKHDKFSLFKP